MYRNRTRRSSVSCTTPHPTHLPASAPPSLLAPYTCETTASLPPAEAVTAVVSADAADMRWLMAPSSKAVLGVAVMLSAPLYCWECTDVLLWAGVLRACTAEAREARKDRTSSSSSL
jgi:hypothetical protein